MTANSSLYDGIHSLLPIWVALRNLGDAFVLDSHVSDLNAVPTPGSKQLCKLPLGSSRVQWSGYVLARLSCQCTPSCRIKNRWLRPCIESSSTSLLDRSHSSKKWGFIKFNADDLEHLRPSVTHTWWLWGQTFPSHDSLGKWWAPNCWGLPLCCSTPH